MLYQVSWWIRQYLSTSVYVGPLLKLEWILKFFKCPLASNEDSLHFPLNCVIRFPQIEWFSYSSRNNILGRDVFGNVTVLIR